MRGLFIGVFAAALAMSTIATASAQYWREESWSYRTYHYRYVAPVQRVCWVCYWRWNPCCGWVRVWRRIC
jgi:hypothetical protein